jgi:hydrogenase maturation protease
MGSINTLVLGIGNILWADEGFGVRAVAALNAGWRLPDEVILMDGGTQGLYLLPHVQAARRVLVLDAIDYGLAPGTLRVLRDDEIPGEAAAGKLSPHQASFQEVMFLARLAGRVPEQAAVIGVQPETLADFGGSLSDTVRARLPDAIAAALDILAAWGHGSVPRTGEPPQLMEASLDLEAYEQGRPRAEDACRIGDARVLAMRGYR